MQSALQCDVYQLHQSPAVMYNTVPNIIVASFSCIDIGMEMQMGHVLKNLTTQS